jgi:hypothetical protein
MDEVTYKKIIQLIVAKGLDPERLQKTEQKPD